MLRVKAMAGENPKTLERATEQSNPSVSAHFLIRAKRGSFLSPFPQGSAPCAASPSLEKKFSIAAGSEDRWT